MNEMIDKIIEIIKTNFENMNYNQIILDCDIDEELKDFDVFYASIRYDLEKLLNKSEPETIYDINGNAIGHL